MADKPEIADINQFISPWLQEDLKKLDSNARKEFLVQYESAIQELLEKFEKSPMNQGATGQRKCSVRIGGTKFLNVKSTLLTLVNYGVPLVLAGTIAAPLLAAVGITVAGTVSLTTAGSAVAASYGTCASLNSVEMDTYLAVAAAIEQKKMTLLVNSGATVNVDSFKRDKQLPSGKIRIHPFDSTKSQHFGQT
jgi:hypothetical protein